MMADGKNSEDEVRQPERPEPEPQAEPTPLSVPGEVYCPQCGGTNVLRCSGLLVFNVAVVLVLACVTLPTLFGGHGTVTSLLLLVLAVGLVALPTTVAIAFVGKRRCRDCSGSFRITRNTIPEMSASDWPWFGHVLNALALVLLCALAPALIRAHSGGQEPAEFALAGDVLVCGLLLWISLLWQVVLYGLLRGRVRRTVTWAVLFTCPAILGGGRAIHTAWPSVRAGKVLAHAGLVSLPPSASGVRCCTWWCPDQTDAYVRFVGEPDEVEAFLRATTALGEERSQPSVSGETGDGHLTSIVPDTGGPPWYEAERATMSRHHVFRLPDDDGMVTVHVFASEANVVLLHRTWMQLPPSERNNTAADGE